MWGGHLSLLALASIARTASGQAQLLELSGACAYDNFLNGLVFEYKGRTQDGAPWYKALSQGSYYIYYDVSCNSSSSVSARWIIGHSAPSTSRVKDLDGDGKCEYHAYSESSSTAQPPSDATWHMHCGGSGQQLVLRLAEVQPSGTTSAVPTTASLLQVDGACVFKNWLNGMVFAVEGHTATGAPFYKSTSAEYYIYFDPDCAGSQHGDPRWIIDNNRPSLYKMEDLDEDGNCVYQARVRVGENDWRQPPLDALWKMDCGGHSKEDHRLTMAVLTSTSTTTGTTVTTTVTTVTTTRTSTTVTSRTTTSTPAPTTTPPPTTTITETATSTNTRTTLAETTTATATSTVTQAETTTAPRATCENFACPVDTILRSVAVPAGAATAAECCAPDPTASPNTTAAATTTTAITAAATTSAMDDNTTSATSAISATSAEPTTTTPAASAGNGGDASTSTAHGHGHGDAPTTTPHSSGHGGGHEEAPSTLKLRGVCNYMRLANGLNFQLQGTTRSGAPFYKAQNYYIYYDPDCDGSAGENTASRWILDDNSPNLVSANDLDSDGECKYQARIDSSASSSPPASGRWTVFCGSEAGWTQQTLTLQPEYIMITSGACADVGRVPITSAGVCATAATALDLSSSVPVTIRSRSRPEGCYWDSVAKELQFTASAANRGNGALNGLHPLCVFDEDTQAAISLGRGFDLPTLAVLLAVAVGLHHADR